MNKIMESEFESSSTINILKPPRNGKNNQTKLRIKYVLGTISVGILGLIFGFALASVLIKNENPIKCQCNTDGEKEPGKLI